MNACAAKEDLREFAKVFADETTRKVFEMEFKETSEKALHIDFHYCPLVAAWKKAGASNEDIALLCDIAMDGDRGIVSRFDGYSFELGDVIAKGEPICQIRIDKK